MTLNSQIDKDRLIVETLLDGAAEAEHSEHQHSHSHQHHQAHHSHSHHKHHHHHRSGSRNSRREQEKSFRKFVRKNKKRLVYSALTLVFFVCSVFAGVYLDRVVNQTEQEKETAAVQSTDGNLLVSVPVFDQDAVISGSAVQAYLQADEDTTVHEIYERYNGDRYRLDAGLPVVLTYEIKGAPKGYAVKSATFTVSEEAADGQSYTITSEETSASFYNLKTGTRYNYRIDITFTNGTESAVCGEFRTATGPRMMSLDGVYNMRDVGGWITTDGQVVRQGLLYRGCEIDGAVVPQYTITKEGIHTMLTELGIKTDMDLRPASENPYHIDILGATVEHIHYGAPRYVAVFNAGGNSETMRTIFSDLADASQYPAYLHCTYGLDRTGTVCYLLGALLGVSQEDLMKDYELSALQQGYVASDEMNEFVERVNQLPGATLKEKVEGYLLTIGVTKQEIQSIRDIFLG